MRRGDLKRRERQEHDLLAFVHRPLREEVEIRNNTVAAAITNRIDPDERRTITPAIAANARHT